MFYLDIKSFLNTVCREIKYEPVRNGISEELEQHINEIKEEYINKGMQEKEAEEKAVSQMGGAEEIGKKLNKIHRPKLDWKLILLIAILVGFGILVTFMKTYSMVSANVSVGNTIIHILIGIALSIGIYILDYKKIKKHSFLIYIISTFIMMSPVIRVNGTYMTRFLGVSFPPAIVALPLYLIAFIGFIFEYKKDNNFNIQLYNKELKINKNLIKIMTLSIISLLLMVLIQTVTNMIILASAYLIVATIKIIKDKEHCARRLTIMYGAIFTIVVLFVINGIMSSSFRFDRIIYSFNPEADPGGSGYIGMLQKEILQKAKIIGEAENTSIPIDESILNIEGNYTFIYLIGKCGLLVAGILVITIILTSIRLIFDAKNIKEQYGKFLVIGLGSLFIVQSFATILMNVNMGIQTNVNLPFVTYGGVYFIVNMMSMAIILSVYRRKDINMFEREESVNGCQWGRRFLTQELEFIVLYGFL